MTEEFDEEEIYRAERAEELINEIVGRCDLAGIDYEDFSDREDFGVIDVNFVVSLPSGRRKRDVTLWEVEDLEEFNSMDFEKYTIVGNYAAICRYDKNIIEAAFTVITETPLPNRFLHRRILKAFGVQIARDRTFEPLELTAPNRGGPARTKILIRPCSSELKTLANVQSSLGISIEIHSRISTHAEAIGLLEKLCHSLFFEVEVKNGLAPALLRKRERRFRTLVANEMEGPEFPKYEYDEGAMSLYWYGRSAVNMPLLQFLAFYQVVEFYFPVYFKAELNRKVRAILKDPSFQVEKDSDISRITVALSARSGGYGSERDQLKATLRECIDTSQLEEFIEENPKRAEFFSSKQKGLTHCTVNLKNKGADLIGQVADRVYDIRCKVVHVKSEDGDTELELLLPYTEEAEKLGFDIELIQFLAKKVLICSSSPIKI
ncbi:hypothetical protein [Marinobacter sp. OP 3.4]|uniref:hypothetical protein n=1 Tax=Marinobacter sp. OP 3.4 TaxID=3076501 RepID=UPI002E2096DD